jgi:adenylate cyclase
LAFNYAGRLVGAYLLSITAAVAILIPLGGETLLGTQHYFTPRNIIGSAVLAAVGTIAVAIGAVLNIAPTLRWFTPGLEPDERQRKASLRARGWSAARSRCCSISTAGSASSCRRQ